MALNMFIAIDSIKGESQDKGTKSNRPFVLVLGDG